MSEGRVFEFVLVVVLVVVDVPVFSVPVLRLAPVPFNAFES